MLVEKFYAGIVIKIVLNMASFPANNVTGVAVVKEHSLQIILLKPADTVQTHG